MGIREVAEAFKHKLVDLLYPPFCVGCDILLDRPSALCPACFDKYIQEIDEQCGVCFQPIRYCSCSLKGLEHRGIRHLYKVFPYHPGQTDLLTNKLIYVLKDKNLHYAAEFLAWEMHDVFIYHGLNLSEFEIVYIPASTKRMAEKGFNQMATLSKFLGKYLGIKVSPVLYRTREAKPQKELRERERVDNTKGLFAVRPKESIAGRKFIVIDDVVTTGSTLVSAGKVLRDAGASKVIYAAISVTTK